MIVAVGSTNPTKITPVEQVFGRYLGEVTVRAVAVESGVSDQPMSDQEMYLGASNRARRAIESVARAEWGVGIEGGLEERPYGWFEKSLVVIVDRKGNEGIGASGGLVLPSSIISKIKAGKNLEEAVDEVFGTTAIGEGIGMFGIFTKEVVTRAEGVRHGVALAMARFLHPKLYEAEI